MKLENESELKNHTWKQEELKDKWMNGSKSKYNQVNTTKINNYTL